MYAFLAFFFPACILALFVFNKSEDIKRLWRSHKWHVLLNSILSAVTYYLILQVFSVMPISVAYPLLQLATLLTVLGGIVLFKEKDRLFQKAVATILVIAGAILLKAF